MVKNYESWLIMRELTCKVLSGAVMAVITGGVLLWAMAPGVALKREYEHYNGKTIGAEHTLQTITIPPYADVREVTALEACNLQDGICCSQNMYRQTSTWNQPRTCRPRFRL